MNKDSRIFVAGHGGLVGSALCRVLRAHGFTRLITVSHKEVDLTNPVGVKWLFSSYLPEYVIIAAAKVGGIIANSTYPVDFMVDNMRIEMNLMENARDYGVKKLLFLSSSCAYPKFAEVPIKEEALLTGSLEPSNEPYALAKISGIKLCDAYRAQNGCDFLSGMPTNLYGIGDHYHLSNSHVIPGMIRRVHEAKVKGEPAVTLWGTGTVYREFLFADDLAEACIVLMQTCSDHHFFNIGYGLCMTVAELADRVVDAVGYTGKIIWDTSKPDGTPKRLLDSSRIFSLGWRPKVGLSEGLKLAYKDFLCQQR